MVSFILPGNSATGGYNVDNSLRFDDGSTDYLSGPNTNAGSTKTKFTFSAWIKRSNLASVDDLIIGKWSSGNDRGHINFSDTPNDTIQLFEKTSGSTTTHLLTNRLFRDVSAWYHIVYIGDTTQGTASNRLKLYVNGVQETSFATATYPNQDSNFQLQAVAKNFGIGAFAADNAGASPFSGYMAEIVYLDGVVADITDFGEFDSDSGIWKPIDVSGLTFGTNGFYLDFEDSSALGNDAAGSNNFTVNNLTAIDQTTDTCTNNFATWNPLFRKGTTTPAFAEGNLKSTFDDGGANEFALTTFGVDTGKWYAEVKWTSATGTGATATGILDMAYSGTADPNNAVTNAFGYFGNGNKNVSGTASSYGASYTSGDIIGIALNCDDNQVTFYKNGSSQGTISIVSGVTYGIFASDYNNKVAELNTGNPPFSISSGNTDGNGYGNFEYAVPSGYYSLNSKNLAEYG